MNCPICASSSVDLVDIKYPMFRQLDYAAIKLSGCIGRCCFSGQQARPPGMTELNKEKSLHDANQGD